MKTTIKHQNDTVIIEVEHNGTTITEFYSKAYLESTKSGYDKGIELIVQEMKDTLKALENDVL